MSVGEGEGKGKKKRPSPQQRRLKANHGLSSAPPLAIVSLAPSLNIMNDGRSEEKKGGIRKRGLSEVVGSTPDDPFFRITPFKKKNALER